MKVRIYPLILVYSIFIILLCLPFSKSTSPTIATLAGSFGTTNDAYHFLLHGGGIHIPSPSSSMKNDGGEEHPVIFVTDTRFCVVRRIVGNTSLVVAGTGGCGFSNVDSVPGTSCQLMGPTGVFYDSVNNFLYILDQTTVKLLDMSSGIIATMMLTFPSSTVSSFYQLSGITMYNGDLYIADTGNALVWKLKITYRNVGVLSIALGTLYQGGNTYCNIILATSCKLIKPTSVSFTPDGIMVVSDSTRILLVSTDQRAYIAPLSISQIHPVQAIAYDQSNILISDGSISRFILFNMDQKTTSTVLDYGWSGMGYFGMMKSSDGFYRVYFLTKPEQNTARNEIITFTLGDTLPVLVTKEVYGVSKSFELNSPMEALSAYLPNPQQLRMTRNYELYFPVYNSAIVKLDVKSGIVTRIAGSITQFGYNQDSIPATIALLYRPNTVIKLDSGDLIISDTNNNRIRKIDTQGIITTIVGNGQKGNSGDYGPATQCSLSSPQGLAPPPASMAGQFIFDFADSDNNRIRRLQNDMTVVPVVGSPGISGPNGIFYTPNGDLYIANQNLNQITKFSNSLLTPVAGNGYSGYTGDGGTATMARLNYPSDVTVSSTGEVFIADWGNRVVRKVFTNGTITTMIPNSNSIDNELNGVTMTPNDDLIYSGHLTVKVYMNGNTGSCIDRNTCSNHGSCDNGLCVCDSGWRGDANCGTFSCNTEKPIHALNCIGPNEYSCINGWTGSNCEIPVCFGIPSNDTTIVCNSHGKCISNDTCSCESGWRGDASCGTFSCNTERPINALNCIGPNEYSCTNGWTGSNCEIPVCFGIPSNDTTIVCNSHGKCISNDTCLCESGWRGNSDCSQFSCDIPSIHGTKCVGPNIYECQNGWLGNLCDIPLCGGIPANSSLVCNSHGTCTSHDTCTCNSGWRGNSECSLFSCDGVGNCKPHGVCILNNTCKCSDGFGGPDCSLRSCFGQWGGCSNNGICIDTNKCSCFPLYFGQQCEWLDCNPSSKDQSINSTKGCSSAGHCKVFGTNSTKCECDTGFSGDYCQEKVSGNGGVVAAVVVTLLIVLCCLIVMSIVAILFYIRRKRSKSEEMERLIPNSVNDWTLKTVDSEESTNVSSRSTVKSIKNTETAQPSTYAINLRDHFKIREKEYVRVKKIGSGGSGQVFQYNEVTENEQVAVKIIEVGNPNGSEFKEVVNMFELSEESHPCIVPILGCTMVENGGYICIIMPLYQYDLRNWAHLNHGIIPIELIVEIVKQLCQALIYLHSKNMVHRDLKQTNIFVAKAPTLSKKEPIDTKSFQLALGDWGSSRLQIRSNMTGFEGTIQYSSPESIVKAEFSPQSDVWSLGCILYQLLSSDYTSCLMRMKQATGNDEKNDEILLNIENNMSKRAADHQNPLYQLCCDLLLEMIYYEPTRRISPTEILNRLNNN